MGTELGLPPISPPLGPGAITFVFDGLGSLYDALDRTYRLGLSLPDAPLHKFQAATLNLLRGTEAERLAVQRVGQNVFRDALIAYWDGRCPLTGISDPSLLRASHIVPWAECTTDEHRLDVHNGLLLSALWDAAFDAGLVSFADDGTVFASQGLSADAASALGLERAPKLTGLTVTHRTNLEWHRTRYKY